jgi:hypothetical protein
MIRRLRSAATVLAAAVAAAAVCAAGSLWRQAALVARVDGDSAWSALHSRRAVVFATWRSSLDTRDWLLFAAAGLLGAALAGRRALAAATRRLATRFAGPPRGAE